MATAELISDVPQAATKNVVPMTGGSARGATQDYVITTNSQRYPVAIFFAPLGDRGDLNKNWGDLLQATVRALYIPVVEAGRSSVEWDRLTLELMRISSLRDNWDGEGAEAIPLGAVSSAQILLQLARGAAGRLPGCPLPALFPSTEGGIIFKWFCGQKELKCLAMADVVEVLRWRSPEQFESEGLWEIPAQKASEHFEWLLR
jgi:hypothetical protein